jgi:catechol 2,3-dioxygenase-like lactoylglutathione lyase family enzyme
MSLHGLAEMTLGVANVEATKQFYRDFGLTESPSGLFATTDGGEQLRVVESPYRRLVEFAVAADDVDDVERIRRAATAHGLDVTDHADGSISMVEPVVGIRAKVTVRARIEQRDPYQWKAMNAPGNPARSGTRAPAIFESGPAKPRKLGHVLYTSTDFAASKKFLIDVLGFKVSDTSGPIAFLRCSTDHHNVGLIDAPVPFFHHSSWQVNDLDEIGQGAQNLLAVDPSRNVWGLGRHFLGSNLFWYFRDPAGNFAEYYADLDQIPEDMEWDTPEWAPDKSLYAWGPPVPPDFVQPSDLEEIVAAMNAATTNAKAST